MIRLATTSEIPTLARMMAESALLQRYRTTVAGARASLEMALADGDVVLVSGEPPDGFAWLSFAPRVLNGAAYLRLLLVAEAAHGLGSVLLREAERVSHERARHLYFLVTTDNVGARRFYERRGYRHVGDLPGLVWPDLDEALYYKTLASG